MLSCPLSSSFTDFPFAGKKTFSGRRRLPVSFLEPFPLFLHSCFCWVYLYLHCLSAMGRFRNLCDTEAHMEAFRRRYEVPDDVILALAPPDTDTHDQTESRVHVPLLAVVEGGVRFPLHPLLVEICSICRLTPLQLCPHFLSSSHGSGGPEQTSGHKPGLVRYPPPLQCLSHHPWDLLSQDPGQRASLSD